MAAAPHCFRLFPLLGREDRIHLPPGPPYNRIQLRLYLMPDCPELPALDVHNRVDPGLLIGGEIQLPGKASPELPVARWMGTRPVLETRPAQCGRQQQQTVQRNTRQTSG